MFNKVRLSTTDYTTGRAPRPLSMPLAAVKTVFPKTCGVCTEMPLSRDTCTLCLDLSGLCCPVLVQRQIAQENDICRRVAQLCREDAAICAVSHVGLVVFLSRWCHLTGWSEKPLDPFLAKVAKKGLVVSKTPRGWGRCFQACLGRTSPPRSWCQGSGQESPVLCTARAACGGALVKSCFGRH